MFGLSFYYLIFPIIGDVKELNLSQSHDRTGVGLRRQEFIFASLFFVLELSAPSLQHIQPSPCVWLYLKLCLAIDDSELPLLFISTEFIRQLIPVARVGGGYRVRSAAISWSVLWVLSCSEPHSGEAWPFMTKCIFHYPPGWVQQVIKCSFVGVMRRVSVEQRNLRNWGQERIEGILETYNYK